MTGENKEIPKDGWWPDDDRSPVTQLYRMRGRSVAQVINQGKGWRAFSMVEMNKSRTSGLPLADHSYTRSEAKTICEVYAQTLYSDVSGDYAISGTTVTFPSHE